MKRNAGHSGFTIVELLIVIVVIAILATVSIVSYSGVQNRALDSAAKLELSNAGRQLGIFYAQNGRYPTTVIELNSIGMKWASNVYAPSLNDAHKYCAATDGYTIASESKSGNNYYMSSYGGSVKQRVGGQAQDWCKDNYSMSNWSYSAWSGATQTWDGSRSSSGL